MRPSRTGMVPLLRIAAVLLLAGCADQEAGPSGGGTSPALVNTTQPPGGSSATRSLPAAQGASMDIQLTVAGTTLRGTLEDSAAGRDFAALLPITVTLTDFAATEKIADLPRRLNTSGAPDGVAGRAGDLAYYAPWGNLAIFYRDSSYVSGLVRLGTLDTEAVSALADQHGDVAVTIEAQPGRSHRGSSHPTPGEHMSAWPLTELSAITAADDLHIEPLRADGITHARRPGSGRSPSTASCTCAPTPA